MYLKIINNYLRNQILAIFVSPTEKGLLAFLGLNERNNVEREESWKYSFQLVRATIILKYCSEKTYQQ